MRSSTTLLSTLLVLGASLAGLGLAPGPGDSSADLDQSPSATPEASRSDSTQVLAQEPWSIVFPNTDEVDYVVPPGGANVTLTLKLTRAVMGDLIVTGPGSCNGWVSHQGFIFYSGPNAGFVASRDCGAVPEGSHTVQLELTYGWGEGTILIEGTT